MNILYTVKQYEQDVNDIFTTVKDFFVNIGMSFYNTMVDLVGEAPAKAILIAGAALLVGTILLKVINRN